MLEVVADGLDDLVHQVVFVGGTVACLYLEKPEESEIRPSKDVDCVFDIQSLLQKEDLEKHIYHLNKN